jgi:hypothetical protein
MVIYIYIFNFSTNTNFFYSVPKPKKAWTRILFTPSSAITLVVFGDGMKNKDTNKIKGLQSGVTGVLRKKLLQRSR